MYNHFTDTASSMVYLTELHHSSSEIPSTLLAHVGLALLSTGSALGRRPSCTGVYTHQEDADLGYLQHSSEKMIIKGKKPDYFVVCVNHLHYNIHRTLP